MAAVGSVMIALVLSGAATRRVTLPSSITGLQKLASLSLGLRIAVVLSAAIREEFIYRGFGIEELADVTGRPWLAGLLSLLLFTAAHAGLYGLSAALIIPGLVGAVLTGLHCAGEPSGSSRTKRFAPRRRSYGT